MREHQAEEWTAFRCWRVNGPREVVCISYEDRLKCKGVIRERRSHGYERLRQGERRSLSWERRDTLKPAVVGSTSADHPIDPVEGMFVSKEMSPDARRRTATPQPLQLCHGPN